MFNVPKISKMLLIKRKCPMCTKPLVETQLTGQKFTCRVSCPTCKISHEGYHFYDCYDSLFNNILNRLRMKVQKHRKHNEIS